MTNRLHALACGLLIVTGPAATGAPEGTGLEPALELLDRLDEIRIDAAFEERRLDDVFETIRRDGGVPLRADWDALFSLGVRPTDEVTYRMPTTPMSTVLAGLLLAVGDDFAHPVYEVHAGMIVITTLERTEPMRLTDVYDVRGILADERTIAELRGEPGDPGDEGAAPEPPALSPGRELLTMIVEHVDPAAWIDFGGARSRVTERDGVLMVSAPPTTHRRLRDALARLRSANPSGVRIRATIVDLPDEPWTRALERYPAGSRALAGAVLRQAGGEVVWRTMIGGRFDTPLHAETTTGESETRLDITPRRGEHGAILLDVDAETRAAARHGAVRTTLSIPSRLGAAVVELPGGARDTATRRLLVLVPDRL